MTWVSEALELLAERAVRTSAGVVWATRLTGSSPMDSWCHGAPGYSILWNTANAVCRTDDYAELATEAARTTMTSEHLGQTLCCGDGGRVSALTLQYGLTGDGVRMDGARRLSVRAVRASSAPMLRLALLKGDLGAALATLELDSPQDAAFPLGLSAVDLVRPVA